MADRNRRDFLKVLELPVRPLPALLTQSHLSRRCCLTSSPRTRSFQHTWFATQCTACPVGCGVVAKNREGRVIMLEGGTASTRRTTARSALRASPICRPPTAPTGSQVQWLRREASWDDAFASVLDAVKVAQSSGKKIAWLGASVPAQRQP